MHKYLLALVLLVSLTHALPHSFGEVLPCYTTATTYDFLGSSLTIQCGNNATFSLSLYASLQTQFASSDIKVVTAGVALSVGFNLSVSPASTVLVQATFVTPSVSATSQADLESNFDAGVLQYDSATQSYNQIDIDSYNYTTKAITFVFPEAGVYVLVAFNSNAFLPAWYGRNHTVPSNSTRKFQYPSGLSVELYSRDNNVLSVNYTTSNPYTVTPSGLVYNRFWVFESHTEQHINATLKYLYNKTEAIKNSVNVSRLHWVFYNETSAAWEAVTGASVDVTAGAIVQVTPHFSTWAVSDSSASTSTTGGSGSTGSASTTGSGTGSTTSSASFVQLNGIFLALCLLCKLLM